MTASFRDQPSKAEGARGNMERDAQRGEREEWLGLGWAFRELPFFVTVTATAFLHNKHRFPIAVKTDDVAACLHRTSPGFTLGVRKRKQPRIASSQARKLAWLPKGHHRQRRPAPLPLWLD